MAPPPVSVIIVSRGRPERLRLCLTGLAGLFYPAFEIVVVADPAGAAVVRAGWGGRVKVVDFDEANISAARNAGIAQAAGEICAFIDDDAVPEPTWLDHLVAPFEKAGVAAVGGFVRGRNGISFQWKARSVDRLGRALPLTVDARNWSLPAPPEGRAVKTEGTNMAVRRGVLAALGGFDEGYRFYLDETDLNLRLMAAGHHTAIAPLAQVHHAYAASPRRRESRAVTDLREIGASTTYFLRRHAPEDAREARRGEVFREQQARVFGQLRKRMIRKGDVGPLMEGLIAGFEDGRARTLAPREPLPAPEAPFLPFDGCTGASRTLAGRIWQAGKLREEAAKAVAAGDSVSLYLFSPTPRRHRVRLADGGWWEQAGGLFGQSERRGWPVILTGFGRRLRREVARVKPVRERISPR